MKLSTEAKISVGSCAALAGIFILGFVSYQSTREISTADLWVSHTHALRQSIADLLNVMVVTENRRRGYLLTSDRQYLQQFLAGIGQIRPAVQKLTELAARDPEQQESIAKVTTLIERCLAIWGQATESVATGNGDADEILPLIREPELRVIFADLSSALAEMDHAQDKLLRSRTAASRRATKRTISIAVLGGGFSTLVVLLAIITVRRDMVKRRRNEEELKLYSERLTQATTAASIGIWEWDLRSNQLFWDQRMFEIYGHPKMPTVPLEVWLQAVHPEDAEKLRNSLKNTVTENRHDPIEIRILRRDNALRYVQISACVALDDEDKGRRVVGIHLDITERKGAELKMQEQANLLELASDAIVVRGLDEKVRFWNDGAHHLYGWTAEEALGGDFVKMTYEDPTAFEQAKKILFERREWSGEVRKVRKGGNEIIVASRWTLLSDDSGRPRAILVIDTDITEKKQLEALLLRNQRLESIGQLAGGIAHDLNNILSPILMGAQMLRRNPNTPENPYVLAMIEASAQRGADIVKQVVGFAKGVEGKRVLVQPRYVIGEVGRIIREAFPKSITFKIQEPKNLWPIMGDATQVHQVLLNLAVNARDAMPNGGTLTIKAENIALDEARANLRPALKQGPHVLLTVSDTGAGIPPQIADKIFDPFFTTKEIDKGTGLGLSTVMGIMKSHKGHIEFQSKVDQGTQFRVYFPAEPNVIRQLTAENGLSAAPPEGKGELILIVDDEEAVRFVTSQILESHGYRTLVASRGTEAVARYLEKGTEISLVLTDLHMPGMGGSEAISVLQKLNPGLRIVVTTGASTAFADSGLKNIDVEACIKKPFDVAQLLETLHKVLRRN
jgi:two-component system, cell cycle sensor histidine kinase and response regulator CckA